MQNAASGTYALKVMTVVAAVLFPVVLLYQGWTYYVFRERVPHRQLLPDGSDGSDAPTAPTAATAPPVRRPRPADRRPGASPAGAMTGPAARAGGEAPGPPAARCAGAARGHLAVAAGVPALVAVLVLVQAFAVADLVVGPVPAWRGRRAALRAPLLVLAGAVTGRALLAGGRRCRRSRGRQGEVRAAAAAAGARRPARAGVAVGAGRGRDRDAGHAGHGRARRVLHAVPPGAAARRRSSPSVVVGVVLSQDLLAGLLVLATVPLVPVFAFLVGTATRAPDALPVAAPCPCCGAHFLDVVRGCRRCSSTAGPCPGGGHPVHGRRPPPRRRWRHCVSAFLSSRGAGVRRDHLRGARGGLHGAAAGRRHLDLHTGLVVLVLAPEAYWPLRQVAVHFHDSADGLAAAGRVFEILDTPAPAATPALAAARGATWPGATTVVEAVEGHLRRGAPGPRRTST